MGMSISTTIPEIGEADYLNTVSVEDLVHTPSESDGISEGECDLPVYDDFSPKKDEVLDDIISIPPGNGIVEADLDPKEDIRFIKNSMYDNSFPRPPKTLKDDSETVIDSNNDYFLSDDDSYENIDYVDASPAEDKIVSLEVVEIVIPEVGGIDDDILLTIKDDILHEKFLLHNPLNLFLEETNTVDNSLPKTKTFCSNLEEISSGSTTTHADFSLPKYDSFIFDLSINPFPPADRSDFYHEEFVDELAHIISPPDLECFYFKSEPDLGDLTSIDPGIRENVSTTN
ncbi:hypothetical protein Tco_0864708 [Tanacetum coccineum]